MNVLCRIIVRSIWIIITLALVIVRWWAIYMDYHNSNRLLLPLLQQLDPKASINYYTDASGSTIKYAQLWDITKETLLFMYGTPGSLSDALPLLEKTNILTRYHVIIPDRPGFGWWMKWLAMTDIKQQAQLLSQLLYLPNNSPKVSLIWRSYAWALIPHIATTHPDKIASIVIIAGTMDPDNQTIWKISYPLHYTWLRYVIPSMLRVTNAEKLSSITQLKTLSWDRSKITAPVWLIHGTKDRIVDIKNTYFAQKQLINSSKVIVKIIDDVGHEIPMTQPQVIFDILEQLIDK